MEAGEVVRVLAVSSVEEDHRALGHIFSHSKWHISRADSCGQARVLLRESPVQVIICSRELPDGGWKDLLAETAASEAAPRIVVAAPSADDKLWGEVLDLGGYDVLGTPFDAGEVIRVVSLAWRQWKHDLEQTDRRSSRPQPGSSRGTLGRP